MPRAARTGTTRTRSARAVASAPVPLGSLTQRGAHAGQSCRACGESRVTRIAMSLTDGTPVQFTSCHTCEHRSWERIEEASSEVLDITQVLDKTRKTA